MNVHTVTFLMGVGLATCIGLAGFVAIEAVRAGWKALQRFNRWAWPLPTDTVTPEPVYPSPELAAAFAKLDAQGKEIDALLRPPV